MKSITFLKTVDIVVWPQNFDKAVAAWEKLLGEKAIPMKPEYNPGGKAKASHIALPAGQYACHAVGIFTPTEGAARDNDHLRKHLEKHGEGVYLLAFMVDDLDKAQAEARQDGFKLGFDKPQDYAVGMHNFIVENPELQDMKIQLAVHRDGGLDQWRKGE